MFCLALLAVPGYGQGVTGRWVIPGRTLDNGEQQKTILELKQDGSALTGTLATMGFSADVKGTVTGNHFELFGPWDQKRPFLVGDLVNGELHGKEGGRREIVATPAGPEDTIPTVAYIEPPALHKVPYNGLAKTPPMGWNSWNLFAGKIDDTTVRTMADAMVSSGMRDAGYVYVNIDDTWEGVRDAEGNYPVEPQVSRHEGAGGLCAFQGAEAGNLFGARAADLRGLSGQLWARGAGREDLRDRGASII